MPREDPVVAALTGPHAAFAETHGRAMRYDPAVTPFGGMVGGPDAGWDDLASLIGDGGVALMDAPDPPSGWTVARILHAVRMTARDTFTDPADARALELGPDDTADVLELVRLTDPGPFAERTMELGRYVGVRVDGRLVSLAGERLHPAGRTEVSAVCTHPDARGQGLATMLVRTVSAAIQDRGEQPFLHVMEHNAPAIRLYESLGFEVEAPVVISVVVAPGR